MSERTNNPAVPEAGGVIRYWGSRFKSPRQVAHWRGLFEPLVARGWRACLVVTERPENKAWAAELEGAGVELVCLPRPKGQFDWDCVRGVRALCARFRADVFHCENIHTSPMLGAWFARVPVRLWHKHSMFAHFEECRAPSWKERAILSTRLTVALATKVLCVSNPVAEELRSLGCRPDKILVCYNPSWSHGGPEQAGRAAMRTALGLNESEVVVVAVGHTVPVKGWDLLLRAFRQVRSQDRRARLVLVGSTDAPHERACFAELSQFVQENQLADSVKFTQEHVTDVTPYLQAADVFVMASRSEGWSYALIEALQAGLPCLATKVGIASEVIREGVNGFVVERNDWKALAPRLADLVSNDGLRVEFARQAEVPPSVPGLSKYAEDLGRLYESLLDRSPHRTVAAPAQ